MKTTAILILMLIGVCVSLSCNMCGLECVPACGTRYFRPCCFNYLRRKRGPDALKDDHYWSSVDSQTTPEFTSDFSQWESNLGFHRNVL